MARPPKYKTEEELNTKVEEYFVYEAESKNMPSKAGLCLHLGICKDTYNEYKKKFSDPIKRAEHTIEHQWIQRLAGANATGAIFYLKAAMGWKDQQSIDVTTGGLPITGMTIKKDADFVQDQKR